MNVVVVGTAELALYLVACHDLTPEAAWDLYVAAAASIAEPTPGLGGPAARRRPWKSCHLPGLGSRSRSRTLVGRHRVRRGGGARSWDRMPRRLKSARRTPYREAPAPAPAGGSIDDRSDLARLDAPRGRGALRALRGADRHPRVPGDDREPGSLAPARPDGDRAEIITISFWDSLVAVAAFAGDDSRRRSSTPRMTAGWSTARRG